MPVLKNLLTESTKLIQKVMEYNACMWDKEIEVEWGKERERKREREREGEGGGGGEIER